MKLRCFIQNKREIVDKTRKQNIFNELNSLLISFSQTTICCGIIISVFFPSTMRLFRNIFYCTKLAIFYIESVFRPFSLLRNRCICLVFSTFRDKFTWNFDTFSSHLFALCFFFYFYDHIIVFALILFHHITNLYGSFSSTNPTIRHTYNFILGERSENFKSLMEFKWNYFYPKMMTKTTSVRNHRHISHIQYGIAMFVRTQYR